MRRRVEPQHLEIAPDRAEDLEEARALLGKRDVQFALHRAQPRQVHVGGVDEVDAVQLEVEKGPGPVPVVPINPPVTFGKLSLKACPNSESVTVAPIYLVIVGILT